MLRRASFALVTLALLLGGCGGGGREPPRNTRPQRPVVWDFPGIDARETKQCLAELDDAGVQFTPLPDRRFDGGCSAVGAVQLLDVGVPVANLRAMRCPLAKNFAAWARHGVLPAARVYLKTEVVKIESFGTYSCRNVNGAATGKLSQHAYANAVDISAFVLADGRRITVLAGWNGEDADVRRFLRVIHESACKRFNTVLGPNYNSIHANHLHFDMGRGPFCR